MKANHAKFRQSWYYFPNGFPISVRKNVSSSAKFIGDSDAEMIYEIQDTMNKVSTRMTI